MEKYYLIATEIDWAGYNVKGTVEAAIKFGEKILKEEYNIWETDLPAYVNFETGEGAHSYDDLLIIEEVNETDFLDWVYCSWNFFDTKGKQWILEHRDDFYDILNDDGTCKKKHLY